MIYRGGSTCKLQLPVANPPYPLEQLVESLPKLDQEPQEFELLTSSVALQCAQFHYEPSYHQNLYQAVCQYKRNLLWLTGAPPLPELVGPPQRMGTSEN